jgi:transposase-like protein
MNIIQVYKMFPTQLDCLSHLEKARWKGKPKCPYCGSTNATPMKKEFRYHCNSCNTSYSVTVGTIFHKTHLDLQKWFLAISLVLNAKKGISARQLSRDLEVNKDTAWYMGMRIRRAMKEDPEMLQGIVEVDETYIGGNDRRGGKRGRGTTKTPVVGMVERGGKIRARKAKDVSSNTLRELIREHIDVKNSTIMTDEFRSYLFLSKLTLHKTINHGETYVDGDIHTNNIEGFWSLLKRGIVGQYHKVSIRYLERYIDEFCYRHNYRNCDDLFDLTLSKALWV